MAKQPQRPQIESILAAPGIADVQEDDNSRKQEEVDDRERQRYDAETEGIKQDIQERKKYANLIYRLVVGWLVVVGLILGWSGCERVAYKLSDQVLITLISGTTINVLGLFAIVANYLFPKK